MKKGIKKLELKKNIVKILTHNKLNKVKGGSSDIAVERWERVQVGG